MGLVSRAGTREGRLGLNPGEHLEGECHTGMPSHGQCECGHWSEVEMKLPEI